MEDVLDSLRRIVSRWVETASPITSDVSPGDTIIEVASTKRFLAGDEVRIKAANGEGEVNLVIESITDDTHVVLATPVVASWSTSENIVLQKLINGMSIEGIHFGSPEVIPTFPAITINPVSVTSEWLTLDSTKERYEVEVTIYVEESTREDGLRFLMAMVDAIQYGLKQNLYPLINDYSTTALIADAISGDRFIKVADSSIFNSGLTDTSAPYPRRASVRAIIEDRWRSEEFRVLNIIDATTIEVVPGVCGTFRVADDSIIIQPRRFIYNSWPYQRDFGKIVKGSLLQAAVVRWFAEEEEVQEFNNQDPHLQ